MKAFFDRCFLLRPQPQGEWSRGRRAAYWLWRWGLTFCAGLCMGLVLLLFAYGGYSWEVFLDYFRSPLLLALNLFPPLLLAWLGYFLSGRCWCGVLLSGLFGVGLPLINYYKVMLRGDPMRASDILLLRTAGGILYKATRRKVKNLNIRVHPDGTVAVSIPFRSSWRRPTALCCGIGTGCRRRRGTWPTARPAPTGGPCPKRTWRWPTLQP